MLDPDVDRELHALRRVGENGIEALLRAGIAHRAVIARLRAPDHMGCKASVGIDAQVFGHEADARQTEIEHGFLVPRRQAAGDEHKALLQRQALARLFEAEPRQRAGEFCRRRLDIVDLRRPADQGPRHDAGGEQPPVAVDDVATFHGMFGSGLFGGRRGVLGHSAETDELDRQDSEAHEEGQHAEREPGAGGCESQAGRAMRFHCRLPVPKAEDRRDDCSVGSPEMVSPSRLARARARGGSGALTDRDGRKLDR